MLKYCAVISKELLSCIFIAKLLTIRQLYNIIKLVEVKKENLSELDGYIRRNDQ